MTTKTGVASVDPVPAATNDGNTPLRQIPGVPSAAPSRSHAGSAAVPHDILRTLRNRREALGWSQRQLAEEIGTAQSHISELETGQYLPGLPVLARWAEALGFTLRFGLVDVGRP